MEEPQVHNSSANRDVYKPSPYPAPPLGELIDVINTGDLYPIDAMATISDVSYVASYNWVKGSSPKIIVPGLPPQWTPMDLPVQVSPDNGSYYRDPNAAYYPQHPMEAAVMATMNMHPEPLPLDIFACSSTLGNLLRFTYFETYPPFRMLVEVVGNTVHMVRRENRPTDLIPDVRGYGHTFPEAFTSWEAEVQESKSHQRMIKYRFADLDILVRFESDGFVDPTSEKDKSDNNKKNADIAAMLADQHLQPLEENADTNDPLEMMSGGREVAQNCIFDLKTRSGWHKPKDVLAEQIHRLWVAQIPILILASHRLGSFGRVNVRKVKNDVSKWEKVNQPNLKRFATLLKRLVQRARESKSFEIECPSPGVIKIRERLSDAGELLSKDTRMQYKAWMGIDKEEDDAGSMENRVRTPTPDPTGKLMTVARI